MEVTTKKIDLLSLDQSELKAFFEEIGEPKYRASQLFTQMHKGLLLDEITNISKATKAKISELAYYSLPVVEQKLVSAIDGTVKYLFGLDDGNCIESVIMRYEHGITICISSQVGCRMGCRFCASTIDGRARDLAPSELLGQIIAAERDLGERISNVVMMGIGEPLDNYQNVIKFLKLLGDKDGLNIGYRHISLSTCGIVPKIKELSKEDLPITLSISLHAANDEKRSEIMPINRKYGVNELLDACREYYGVTGRRISFEYTLISGKNDSEKDAEELATLLNSKLRSKKDTMPIHVNLIPVNEVEERDFVHSGKKAISAFVATLEKRGIRATVRRKLGSDINASCGQLRRNSMKQKAEDQL